MINLIFNKYVQLIIVAAAFFFIGKLSNPDIKRTEESKSAETSTQRNDVVIERETVRPDGTRIVTKRIDKTQKEKSLQTESKREEIINNSRPTYLFGYTYGVKGKDHGFQVQKRLFSDVYFGVGSQFRSDSEVYLILNVGF